MSEDPFSEFSKGNVVAKYDLLELVGNHRLRDRVFTVVVVLWLVVWVWMTKHFLLPWVPFIFAFLPFLFGRSLFRLIFPVRKIGLVSFRYATMTVKTEIDGSELEIDLRTLLRMRVSRAVSESFSSNVRSPAAAYMIALHRGETNLEFIIRNQMYLTKKDHEQFMWPPPPLRSTLVLMSNKFKIRLCDMKGRELDVLP